MYDDIFQLNNNESTSNSAGKKITKWGIVKKIFSIIAVIFSVLIILQYTGLVDILGLNDPKKLVGDMIFDGTKNSVETIFDVMTDGKYKVTETELSDDMYTVTFNGIFRDEISGEFDGYISSQISADFDFTRYDDEYYVELTNLYWSPITELLGSTITYNLLDEAVTEYLASGNVDFEDEISNDVDKSTTDWSEYASDPTFEGAYDEDLNAYYSEEYGMFIPALFYDDPKLAEEYYNLYQQGYINDVEETYYNEDFDYWFPFAYLSENDDPDRMQELYNLSIYGTSDPTCTNDYGIPDDIFDPNDNTFWSEDYHFWFPHELYQDEEGMDQYYLKYTLGQLEYHSDLDDPLWDASTNKNPIDGEYNDAVDAYWDAYFELWIPSEIWEQDTAQRSESITTYYQEIFNRTYNQ